MRRRGAAALILALVIAWIWQLPFVPANATRPTPSVHGTIADARATVPRGTVPTHIPLPRPPDRCSYAAGERDWPPADQTVACVRHEGSGPTVLLIGDSHAEQWAPALTDVATARDWTLLSLTRAKCAPWDVSAARPTDHGSPTLGDICQAWKKVAYPTVISHYRPDLVLIAGRPQALGIRLHGTVISRSDRRWMPTWRRSWGWLVRVATADSAKVGAFTLLPTLPASVPSCLHAHGLGTTRCDMRLGADWQTRGPNRVIRSIHDRFARVWSIRVTSLVCPDHVCRAVIDGRITHADESHLTTRFSRSLAHSVWHLIDARRLLPVSGS
jgi:SGNH domain (fused to AT3 domains)